MTSAKIANGTIIAEDLSPTLIDSFSQALADGSVTTPKLADDAVVTGKIANGTIVADDLAPAAVASFTDRTPPDGSVTNPKLAPNAVTSAKIADAPSGSDDVNADLLDGLSEAALQRRITGSCASQSAVRSINADGTVVCEAVGGGAANIADGSVTTPKLADHGGDDGKARRSGRNGGQTGQPGGDDGQARRSGGDDGQARGRMAVTEDKLADGR